MTERLRFHQARGVITLVEYKAGVAWHGDWIECGRPAGQSRLDKPVGQGGGGQPRDLMREFARQRLRHAQSALGGSDSPTFHAPYLVYLLDREPVDVALQLDVKRTTVLDICKLALRTLATGVYRMREVS